MVRLDAGREQRRYSPLRQRTHSVAHESRPACRAARHDPERAAAAAADPVARDQIECAGLESSIAHTRGYRPFAWIPFATASDSERLLGAAGIRSPSP